MLRRDAHGRRRRGVGAVGVEEHADAKPVRGDHRLERRGEVLGILDGDGLRTAGGDAAATSAADTDPGTASATYSTVSCGSAEYPCAGGSVSSSGGARSVTFTAPGGETAQSSSTTQAWGANVCPPPTDTPQTDQKPCGGSRIQQGGTLSATATLGGSLEVPTLGGHVELGYLAACAALFTAYVRAAGKAAHFDAIGEYPSVGNRQRRAFFEPPDVTLVFG